MPYNLPDCLAIDPGPEDSMGIVSINKFGIHHVEDDSWQFVRQFCEFNDTKVPVLIEGLSNYGQAIGDTTLRTAYNVGRLMELAGDAAVVIRRVDIRFAVLGSSKGNDSIIWQSICERFGGPSAAKKGGPLHGIKSHGRAALALAVAYKEMLERHELKAVRID